MLPSILSGSHILHSSLGGLSEEERFAVGPGACSDPSFDILTSCTTHRRRLTFLIVILVVEIACQ